MAAYVGKFLMGRWDALGLNQNRFAIKVGENPGYVQQVKDGTKTLADAKVDKWAAALELDDEAAQQFADLVAVSHMQKSDQPRFVAILERLRKLEALAKRLDQDERPRRR